MGFARGLLSNSPPLYLLQENKKKKNKIKERRVLGPVSSLRVHHVTLLLRLADFELCRARKWLWIFVLLLTVVGSTWQPTARGESHFTSLARFGEIYRYVDPTEMWCIFSECRLFVAGKNNSEYRVLSAGTVSIKSILSDQHLPVSLTVFIFQTTMILAW